PALQGGELAGEGQRLAVFAEVANPVRLDRGIDQYVETLPDSGRDDHAEALALGLRDLAIFAKARLLICPMIFRARAVPSARAFGIHQAASRAAMRSAAQASISLSGKPIARAPI